MDNPSINIHSKDCNNPQCQASMLEEENLIIVEQNLKQDYEKNIMNNKDFQVQQLSTLKDEILKYQENIIGNLNKSIQQISDQIKSIQQQKYYMEQLDQIMNKYESIEGFIDILNHNQEINKQFRSQILRKSLLDFQQYISKLDFLHSILNQKQQISVQTVVSKKIQISEVIPDQKKNPQQIEYELIQQVKCDRIFDFAIDQRNNTIIAGTYDGVIKIYNFQNGKLGAEIQSLQKHCDSVTCLYCMKNASNFISGSEDNSIIIWCLDNVNKWKVQQTLKGHAYSIYCIIINSQEDLLISGSYDGTIKFWRKQIGSWNLSQTVDQSGYVYALNLNEKEDKLIACNHYNLIILMNSQDNQEWKLVQTIEVDEFGYRLCFTIQNKFAFQPRTSDYLEIYDFDETKEQFYQKTKVQVTKVQNCSELFPCQYIKKLDILTVKHGQFVNIFRVNQNGDLQLIQSIEYQDEQLNGRMTDDGEYLIAWTFISKEIQVRKLKLKEVLS